MRIRSLVEGSTPAVWPMDFVDVDAAIAHLREIVARGPFEQLVTVAPGVWSTQLTSGWGGVRFDLVPSAAAVAGCAR